MGTGQSSVTLVLRQGRLRAAALFLAVGTCLSLVLQLLNAEHGVLVHAAVASLLTVCYLLLRIHSLSRWQLTTTEMAVFGLSSLHLASIEYHGMLHWAALQNALELQAAIKNAYMASMLLMFAYAMLIPNSWRAAARVIAGIALVPVATATYVLLTQQAVRGFVRQEDILQQSASNILIMLFAAALSTYGVHVLNTLRHEAREARRLNQYQLGELIGAGGMGDVYVAEHRLLKRPCAIKLVRDDDNCSDLALARFEHEVRSAARLSHPNIVDIYDYGHSEDGQFYFVMEYLRGSSLEDLVQQEGRQPIERVVRLLQQTCAGLAEAHAAGLIHRDLKPANIFAANIGQRRDVAKLLDFGLVKDTAQSSMKQSHSDTVSGTPQYMAPEQAMNSDTLDHRADIYAFGGVAYFLLTGRPPFESRSAMAAVVANASQPVRPPSELREDIPKSLEQVILRCLDKDPQRRFSTANELSDALANCV